MKMANMKVKIMIGDQIKGTFNNPISPMLKKKEEKIERPLLKTSISHTFNIDTPHQTVQELYNEAAMIRATLIRSSNIDPVLTNISKPEEVISPFLNSEYGSFPCTSDCENTDDIDRAASEEEMMIFDSIESIHEDDRTENENAFMRLYADGNCPPLDELEKALIPIREERLAASFQNEAASTVDEDHLDSKYASQYPDDEEIFKKIKPLNKKSVLDEY